MDTQSSSEDGRSRMSDTSENGQSNEKETSPLILKLDEESESEISQIAKLIQALADKLIRANKAEWRKIQIKDGRKGFALFFPASDWEIVNDELIELNSK